MGALSAEELDVALAAGADVVAWREGFVDASPAAPPGGRCACTSSSTPAWAGSAPATRDEALRASPSAAAARRGLRARPALMTHFATADEPTTPTSSREQLARFAPWASALRERARASLVHAANSAAALREPARALRHGALRDRRSTAWTRSSQRPRRARARAGARARLLRRRGQALRAGRERRLRAPLRRRARHVGRRRCRSATATAVRRGAHRTTPTCWSAGAATRWSGPSAWTTSPSTSGPTPAVPRGRAGDADRRAGRRAPDRPRSWPGGSARSTTRSPARRSRARRAARLPPRRGARRESPRARGARGG